MYALFDRIMVRIEEVSVARRRISAIPVEVLASPAPVQHAPSRTRRKAKKQASRTAAGNKGRARSDREVRRRTKESDRKQRKPKKKAKRR